MSAAIGDSKKPAVNSFTAIELRKKGLRIDLATPLLDGDGPRADFRIRIGITRTDGLLGRNEAGHLKLERADGRTGAGGGGQNIFIAAGGAGRGKGLGLTH